MRPERATVPKVSVTSSRAALLCACLVQALVPSCRDARRPAEAPARAPVEARAATLADVPDEVWDDPATLKEPRLQFGAAVVPEGGPRLVFSMRLDGSDVRRVAAPELLFADGAAFIKRTPVRSPDRRYLAFETYRHDESSRLVLLDLRTRTVRTIFDGRGDGVIEWTPDGRSVVFYGEVEVRQYELDTGKVALRPMIYSQGFYLRDEGRRIVAIGEKAIVDYDRSGKLLRTLALPFEPTPSHALSPDGGLAAFDLHSRLVVVRTGGPAPPVLDRELTVTDPVFGPGGSTLYYFNESDLKALDVASGRVTRVATLPGFRPGETTLLEARSTP